MKNTLSLGLLLCVTIFVSGCITIEPEKTSLEIQAIQSQSFETTKDIAFSSSISVFQDLGYIVKSADKDTGFITAQSATQHNKGLLLEMASLYINSQTNATAYIEEIRPNMTTIRLNFVVTQYLEKDEDKNIKRDKIILEPKIYKSAFNKIGDAIFIRTGS